MLNYYLPRVQTPKGSIVALDVESGSPTTAAVRHALERVKDEGYTAVLYGYNAFLTSHIDLTGLSKDYPLWLGEYPDYNVTPTPNYGYFPSWDNIGVLQFTSTYIAGGLDGNIDLTGITDNGYNGTTTSKTGGTKVKTDSTTPAIKAGQKANNTKKSATKHYSVIWGDNLSTIAYKLGTSVSNLVAKNGIANANYIYPGQRLAY